MTSFFERYDIDPSDEWRLGAVEQREVPSAVCPWPDNTELALDWYCGQMSARTGLCWYAQPLPFGNGLMICVEGAHIHDLVVPERTPEAVSRLVNMVKSWFIVRRE